MTGSAVITTMSSKTTSGCTSSTIKVFVSSVIVSVTAGASSGSCCFDSSSGYDYEGAGLSSSTPGLSTWSLFILKSSFISMSTLSGLFRSSSSSSSSSLSSFESSTYFTTSSTLASSTFFTGLCLGASKNLSSNALISQLNISLARNGNLQISKYIYCYLWPRLWLASSAGITVIRSINSLTCSWSKL